MPPQLHAHVRLRPGIVPRLRWYAAGVCALLRWRRGVLWCVGGALEWWGE